MVLTSVKLAVLLVKLVQQRTSVLHVKIKTANNAVPPPALNATQDTTVMVLETVISVVMVATLAQRQLLAILAHLDSSI